MGAEPYEVVLTCRVRDQLDDAPPVLRGYVAGMVAVLRVDPTAAGSVFHIRRTGDAWTATFGAGLGFLTYWVLAPERIVSCSTSPGPADRMSSWAIVEPPRLLIPSRPQMAACV